MVFPGVVRLHNRPHDILRDIFIIRQKLLRILGQAVSAVTEGRIIIMRPNPGVQANSFYDLTGIKTIDLRVGIQFFKIRNPQR